MMVKAPLFGRAMDVPSVSTAPGAPPDLPAAAAALDAVLADGGEAAAAARPFGAAVEAPHDGLPRPRWDEQKYIKYIIHVYTKIYQI